jgi:maltose O-acetyltransferase
MLFKLWQVIQQELQGLHPRLSLINVLLAPLPPFVGSRLRTHALRAAGFTIGHGSVFWGMPRITGSRNIYRQLVIGQQCVFNVGCVFDTEGTITIGDNVALGQQVMLLTSTHEIGLSERRADFKLLNLPIIIGNGCWLGARCTILPGVDIGKGAIIAAGAVVNRNVPENTLVGGIPARVIKFLD